MSTVRIKFDQYVEAQNAQISAEILNTELEPVTQVVLWANIPRVIDLDPGEYLIRARLPSGELLRKQIALPTKASTAEILLAGQPSPHEWLSLQHFLGYLATTPTPMPAQTVTTTWLQLWCWKDGSWQAEPWPGNEPSGEERGIVTRINLPIDRVWLLQIGGDRVPLRFIAVPPSSAVEVLVRGTTRNTSFNGGITVRVATLDAELEALMSYEASGAAESAALVGDAVAARAEDYASDKLKNPNGAALGFYYLLSRRDLARVHQWPSNFANWFPWLPDAVLINAMHLLVMPGTENRTTAKNMLVRAADSALPVYTRGLRYLLDQLCAYKLDPSTPPDTNIDRVLTRIGTYASAADWNEPRTTFFGARPDAPSSTLVFGPSDSSFALYLRFPAVGTRAMAAIASSGAGENALIEQARNGSNPAFEQLYGLHKRELVGYLRARSARKEDAEDIAQQAWIVVSEKIRQFDPARGNFTAFLKYWASIAALRWQHERKNAFEQTLLFSELGSRFPSSLRDRRIEETVKPVEQQEPNPEKRFAAYESYTALLHTTFATSSPPHQLLAFGFCKLLDWRPQRFVKELSDIPLLQLEADFEKAYLAEVPAEADLVRAALGRVRANLVRTLVEAVQDPATLATYPSLSSRQLGGTKPRDYYRDDPEQNISHWVYAVRRRTLAELGRPGGGQLVR